MLKVFARFANWSEDLPTRKASTKPRKDFSIWLLISLFAALTPSMLLWVLTANCTSSPGGQIATTPDSADQNFDYKQQKQDSNHPPVLHKIGNKKAVVGEELTIVLQAEDPDGDMLSFSIYGDMPPQAKFFKPEGKFSWIPSAPAGPYFVTFVVSDKKSFDSETVELTAVLSKQNHPPQFVPVPDQYLQVGELYELTLEATDEDNDPLVFSLKSSLPKTATFDAQNAIFRWTPGKDDDGKTVRITFSVTDGEFSDEMEVKLLVGEVEGNHPPVIDPIAPQETEVGKNLLIKLNVYDPDNDPVTCFAISQLPLGSTFDTTNCSFSWTPDSSYEGKSLSINFGASDGTLESQITVNILVKAASSACNDDIYEPDNNSPDTAPLLTQGTFQGLSICDSSTSPIDSDWFKLLLESGEQITATITFDSGLGDLDMAFLYASTPTSPLVVSAGLGDSETIKWTAQQAGPYLLFIYAQVGQNLSIGYTLQLERSMGQICQNDSYEPNDNLAQATVLPESFLDGTPFTNLTICPKDLDVFKVIMKCGSSLTASIDFQNSQGDLDLYLFMTKGDTTELVDKSETSTDHETVTAPSVAQPGDYYILVSPFPEAASNEYIMKVVVSPGGNCTPDQAEPNDSPAESLILEEIADLYGLTVCCDEDWFQLPQGTKLFLDIPYSGGKLDVQVVPDGDTSQALFIPCQENQCGGVIDLTEDKTYYVKIGGEFSTQYDLHITVEKQPTAGSCAGKCGEASQECWCDDLCEQYEDCCADACDFCGYNCP